MRAMTLRSNVLTFPGAEAPAQSAAVDFTVVTGGGACGLQYINERGDRDLHCELSHRFSHDRKVSFVTVFGHVIMGR